MPTPESVPDVVATLVTDRPGAPEDGSLIGTADPRAPNLLVVLMSPIAQVLVRAARTYAQGVVGFLLLELAAKPTAAGLGIVVPPGDLWVGIQVAAGLALAPTVVSLLQNSVELLAKLDDIMPRFRA